MPPTSQEILAHLEEQPHQGSAELVRFWGLDETGAAELKAELARLERAGQIYRLRGQGWSYLSPKSPYRIGSVRVARQGHAYVRSVRDPDEEFFVAPDGRGSALGGDLVLAKLVKKRGRVPTGRLREVRVVEVVERSRQLLRGRLRKIGGGGAMLQADGHGVEIYISPEHLGGARGGEKVLVRALPARGGSDDLRGKVEVRLRDEGSLDSDFRVICAEFELPGEFPAEALQEAKAARGVKQNSRWPDRRDLRDLLTFTIDPVGAQDFDDAVSLEQLSEGRVRLGVHIADVSHYVPDGSPLDHEAEARGTSIYLSGRVVPMLPERLSNDLCSLRPEEDRLTKSVFMTFDPQGAMLNSEIVRSVIRSHYRYAYEEVLEVLEDAKGRPVGEATHSDPRLILRQMGELSRILQRARYDRGSLYLDLPKPVLVADDDGNVTGIAREERDAAHSLIEEFMVAANETVARFLIKKKLPRALRTHPPPEGDKFEEFLEFLGAIGVKYRGGSAAEELQQLVRDVESEPFGAVVQLSLLRTMGHAEYSATEAAHFALATNAYCHFTSPIRRYPDLLVHQILEAHLSGDLSRSRAQRWEERLPEVLARASELERRAEEAEREMARLRLIRYLEPLVGTEMDVHIIYILPYGLVVRCEENLVEGLVHVASMGNDFYDYDEKRRKLIGRRRKTEFLIGDKLRVVLSEVNPDAREISFRPSGRQRRSQESHNG